MGNLNKVQYTDHQTVITADNLNAIQDSVIQNTSYTTCSTGASTAAKTAALTNFVLTTGSAVKVKFTNTNTAANPTLNVNSTGAKPIMQYGTTACGTNENTSWSDGAVVEFIYDGTNWVMQGKNITETGIFKKPVYVDTENGTTTTVGTSTLWVGNGTAEGTAGNSKGQVAIYGNGANYVNVQATNATANRTVELPNENGTLMTNQGGTFVKPVVIDEHNGTASSVGASHLTLGNSIASGTVGNSTASLTMYGRQSYYTALYTAETLTSNRSIYFPDAGGTVVVNPTTNGGAVPLTVTRVENAFANADSMSRVIACKKSGILYCSFNFSVTSGGTTSDFVQVGRINGWNAYASTYMNIPGQSVPSQTLLAYISTDGKIYIYSGQTLTSQFFRTSFVVPSVD